MRQAGCETEVVPAVAVRMSGSVSAGSAVALCPLRACEPFSSCWRSGSRTRLALLHLPLLDLSLPAQCIMKPVRTNLLASFQSLLAGPLCKSADLEWEPVLRGQ